ncbi:sulfite exporter TauE/SafE family protein [Geodermatophilus sp. SYSU D00691]
MVGPGPAPEGEAAGATITRSPIAAFATGAGIGVLGGMIGLGGAEFRLPLLIGLFGFIALQAVILNKTMSLIVVVVALPARLAAVPLPTIAAHWEVIVNLLVGSLVGAYLGATWATRMRSAVLYRVLSALLVLIAVALAADHLGTVHALGLTGWGRFLVGLAAGLAIGVVAALMGVAGGELLIPTIVLLYGVELKLAGSLSLAVSLPTMLVAFARYSRDQSFRVVRANGRFVLVMAAGSIAGAVAGGLLLGVVPTGVLIPVLVALLLASAVKVWRHRWSTVAAAAGPGCPAPPCMP